MTLYRELYDRLRSSIIEGKLQPGDRLPSARALAAEANVARGTVETAYALLSGEGFVVSRGRGGTIVSYDLPKSGALKPAAGKAVQRPPGNPFSPLPLMSGFPALDLFPRKLWLQGLTRQARRMQADQLGYPPFAGSVPLRVALTRYLAVSRGIVCDPDHILITGGYQAALGLLCRVLLKSGSEAWVEDPGYPATAAAIEQSGAIPVAVTVDNEGLNVAAGLTAAPDAKLCCIAPAHQFPCGVTMSLRRRLALLEWARTNESWIIEDDYDGEFRFSGHPLPALKSLDRAERVFYIGTFSKTLFPGLRLGYIVAPPAQVEACRRALQYLEGGRPSLEQGVLAEFIASGHFARHLKRMRNAYRSRRSALIDAISARLANHLDLQPGAGGLHMLAQFRGQERDTEIVARAVEIGLGPTAMSRTARDPTSQNALILGFATVPEAQAASVADRLASLF